MSISKINTNSIAAGASPTMTDLKLSGSLFLGGTGSANELSDYEEGTFTPTFSSDGGTITAYTSQGLYRKVGTIVYVHITMQITTLGTATGYLTLSGLPFSVVNAGGTGQIPIIVRETVNTGEIFGGFLGNSGTDGRIHGLTGSTVTLNLVANDRFNISACYVTT